MEAETRLLGVRYRCREPKTLQALEKARKVARRAQRQDTGVTSAAPRRGSPKWQSKKASKDGNDQIRTSAQSTSRKDRLTEHWHDKRAGNNFRYGFCSISDLTPSSFPGLCICILQLDAVLVVSKGLTTHHLESWASDLQPMSNSEVRAECRHCSTSCVLVYTEHQR